MSYKLTVTHSNGKPFVWQAQDGETYLSVTDETGRDLDIRLEGLPVLDDDFGPKGYIGNINVLERLWLEWPGVAPVQG